MSPGAGSVGRFKINLQRNGNELEPQGRMNNSTLGSKANGKLLPMVNTGSTPNSKRQAAYQTTGGSRGVQNYDKSLLCHSPDPISRGGRNMMAESASAAGGSAAVRSKTPTNQIVLEGFGGFEDIDSSEDIVEHSGNCYLKTKTESYKKHWMVLQGNELRFFRK